MNSSSEQLHPNWRALATCHINVKRFVSEGAQLTEGVDERVAEAKQKIDHNGEEMQKFYEEVIHMQTTEKEQSKTTCPTIRLAQDAIIKKLPFNAQKLFEAAVRNDIQTIENMEMLPNAINIRDEFGWTALMMSACAGAMTAVGCLLCLGADKNLQDKRGKTAEQLALQKGFMQIVYLLRHYEALSFEREEEQEAELMGEQGEPFYCNLCQKEFTQTSKNVHMTSTLHKFCQNTTPPANPLHKFNISQRNRGLQLMLKQGWDCASGLGPSSSGRLYPIKTVLRKDRTGLGVQQSPARVTHFKPYDLRATKSKKYVKPRNRHDMEREKLREWKKERRLRNELR